MPFLRSVGVDIQPIPIGNDRGIRIENTTPDESDAIDATDGKKPTNFFE